MQYKNGVSLAPAAHSSSSITQPRRPYVAPALEPLGAWSALTLQQSVPVGPGGYLGLLSGTSRFG